MESPSAMKIMGIMFVGEQMVWNGKPWDIYTKTSAICLPKLDPLGFVWKLEEECRGTWMILSGKFIENHRKSTFHDGLMMGLKRANFRSNPAMLW